MHHSFFPCTMDFASRVQGMLKAEVAVDLARENGQLHAKTRMQKIITFPIDQSVCAQDRLHGDC